MLHACSKKFLAFIISLLSTLSLAYAQKRPASPPHNAAPSLPEKTFEVFWQTFEDQYAFFTVRNIDWKQSYQTYRPRVTASTSDDSLFAIFCQMVTPFNDGHINIIIPDSIAFSVVKPSRFLQEFPDSASIENFWNMVDQSLLDNGFSPVRSIGPLQDGKHLFYYTSSDSFAYLRTGRCNVSEKTEDYPKKDANLAGRILDSVLLQCKHATGIIIDIRNNEGGNDEFAYALAGRFADEKILGHIKQARRGGYEDFGREKKVYIQPQGQRLTNRPVMLLTNDQTFSAADVLAMIMKAMPNVTIIGEDSGGIFSDMYYFELPNKWAVSLSNERYYNAKNRCFEGCGVPVDIEVKNTREDLIRNADPVIAAALEFLRRK